MTCKKAEQVGRKVLAALDRGRLKAIQERQARSRLLQNDLLLHVEIDFQQRRNPRTRVLSLK